jgi:hypothetical protein
MKVALLTLAVLLGPLHATSIDVSAFTSTTLHPGDSISFDLFTWNYSANALAFGQPLNPSDIVFTLMTTPVNTAPALTAFIESTDQSVSFEFAGPLLFTAGYLSTASFETPVSAISGYLHLSDSDSLNLFSSGEVTLRFLNEGDDFDLGVPPQTLRNDLFVSLSGGALTVGALPGGVSQQSLSAGPDKRFGLEASEASVPEPGSTALLLGGGVLLVTVSRLLRQGSRRSA